MIDVDWRGVFLSDGEESISFMRLCVFIFIFLCGWRKLFCLLWFSFIDFVGFSRIVSGVLLLLVSKNNLLLQTTNSMQYKRYKRDEWEIVLDFIELDFLIFWS